MPHAGHFCAASRCQFTMNTYVNGYIVSTVGEYVPLANWERPKFEEIGLDRLYETMVFRAERVKEKNTCCPYRAITEGGELDFAGYNTSQDAYAGHMKMLRKWSKKK